MIAVALAIAGITAIAAAQMPPPATGPLPQDTGIKGLRQTIRKLKTTARLLHTTAHPDDEDGAMLTLESRGRGVETMLLTLNRGEGGQNRLGSNLFDVLGVVRTLELLAADRYYDVEQRFTRAADFGYSKTAAETFSKWGGHDPVLADMVRVIRTFRPDVIVSRFQGTTDDGHGHHQAAGILTREAFHAAADPKRFPEQIREGLQPWQAKKLYIDNARPPEPHTLQLDTDVQDSALGTTYAQFAMQGLRHQLSQGAGEWNIRSGLRYYKLVDSVLPKVKSGTPETGFFDGIDTSLHELANRLGGEERNLPWLRAALVEIERKVDEASAAADKDIIAAAVPLLQGEQAVNALLSRLSGPDADVSPAARDELTIGLTTKLEQFQHAGNVVLGVGAEAIAGGRPAVREGFMAIRGQTFPVSVSVRGPMVSVSAVHVLVPQGWKSVAIGPVSATKDGFKAAFQVTVAADAPFTRPCIHRASELGALYQVEDDKCAVLPLPAPVAHAIVDYNYQGHAGQIEAPLEVEFVQGANLISKRPLAVGPEFSIGVNPGTRVLRTSERAPFTVSVSARTNLTSRPETTFALHGPPEWQLSTTTPGTIFSAVGEERTSTWQIVPPPELEQGTYDFEGSITHGPERYSEGYTLITRPDLGSNLYYQPAKLRVSAVDVKIPAKFKLGYIMGAGDEIPTVLRQIGMNVSIISPEELAHGNLARFDTIVAGIRAYDTREDLRKYNRRLLDYVSDGGTLVIQYNANYPQFNAGHYTPYRAEISRARVSVEGAPVEVLAPQDPIFQYPNEITARDFDGWVQERGLYFMGEWDRRFEPLLASHDPGEPLLGGGLLRAHYGKGTYIYTGYSFFRQLPAGVPGAVRLFVNLVSAGHELGIMQ